MKLVFDIVKSGSDIPAERNFHFTVDGGTIGRNESCNWILSDAQNYISGHHLSIICMDDTYFVKDESTNGTFLKHPYKKLPKGHPVKINASDIFIIGDHEIQARYSYNEYAQDDVIGSINKSQSQDNLIPNDDFLFESEANSFGEVESSTEDDILDLLDDTPEEEDFEDMFDTVALSADEELLADVIPQAAIGDDFNEVLDVEEAIDAAIEPLDEHFIIPAFDNEPSAVAQEKTVVAAATKPETRTDINRVSSEERFVLSVLEQKLGLDLTTVSTDERERMLSEIGDIVLNTLDNLGKAVQIKERVKQDLRLSAVHFDPQTNNPVMLGRSAIKLLQSQNSGLGMLKVSEAITKSIAEINQHSVALHGTTKNLMNLTAMKFAPKQLEHRFESNGALRGETPTPARMWKAYTETFEPLHTNPEIGVEMIESDFSKEYENIDYSLQLNSTTVTGL